MPAQTLLLLVYIEFLDIENQFLLQATFVEIEHGNPGYILLEPCSYARNTLGFKWFYFSEQCRNSLDTLSKERLKRDAFLTAVFHHGIDSGLRCNGKSGGIAIVDNGIAVDNHCVRKAEQQFEHIVWPCYAQLFAAVVDLVEIPAHHRAVEMGSGFTFGALEAVDAYRKVDFAPFGFPRHHCAKPYLMLPQRVRHSHIQIQLLGIERFHFYLYYIGCGSRGGFAESGHRL